MDDATTITLDSPGLCDVPGFQCAGVSADVRQKGDGRLDLALVCSKSPSTAAGVFTTNDVKAAPVILDQQILQFGGPFHGFVANSGNANACTGKQGMADAEAMIAKAEAACGVPRGSMFVCSTGRIGRALPINALLEGIDEAAENLDSTEAQSRAAANAILTSDTRPKTVTAKFVVGGHTVTLAGMAKGAGMIEPNMATMLAFVASDAVVSNPTLQGLLSAANATTFNRITVDGDMSTNDTVLVLANGKSGVDLDESDEAKELFADALERLLRELALKIAGDGERITKLVQIDVLNAGSEHAADKVARAIGNSLLVKTSWFGSDPNWGRIMDAAGYARIGLVEETVDMHYAAGLAIRRADPPVPVLLAGQPQDKCLPEWEAIVAQTEFTIELNLNLGPGNATLFSTDLSEGYVDFNKSE